MSKLLVLIAIVVYATQAQPLSSHQSGFYSRRASPIWEDIAGSPNPIRFDSPDHRSSAVARYVETAGEGKVVIDVEGVVGRLRVDLGPGVASELLWAPDSSAFFVTTSDQGANGSYRVVVICRLHGRLELHDLTPLIMKEFGHPVHCESPEEPNVGGIAWIHGSQRLWVAAEVVNHSNCHGAGTWKAYEVDLTTMAITRFLGQLEAKRRLAREIGEELRNADDRCVRRPSAC